MIYSPVNPKAAAIFRLLTGKAGLTGEYIPGGVLVNPLPFGATYRAISEAITAAQNALDSITLPLPPPSTTATPDPSYEATKGLPKPIPGKEKEFQTLSILIPALRESHAAVSRLDGHTSRVVNNLVDLCGLVSAYTVSIQKLGLGLSINQRITPSMAKVPNMSERDNAVNLGGVNGSGLGQDRGFPQLTTPELLMETNDIPPQLSDLPVDDQYGVGFGDFTSLPDTVAVEDAKMISTLTEIVNQTGIPSTILPPDALLADINPAAHGETLFRSIIPSQYGGKGTVYLTDIQNSCQFFDVDLLDAPAVSSITGDILASNAAIHSLINEEYAMWGPDALRPPTFPSGTVLQTIYTISRCEGIYNLSMDSSLQGILFSCVSPVTLQILRA